MARVVFLRHAEAQEKGTVPNVQRALTPLGCKQACRIREALKRMHFTPDLVVVSDAQRTAQTAALAVGSFMDTVQLPELRLMGLHEYGVVNAIIEARGKETPFVELLAKDTSNLWRRHARMVTNHLRDVIAERNAHQILAVGHHYSMNAIGLTFLGRDDPLLLGPLFNYAEGFMIDESHEQSIVTHITLDSP